MAVPTFVRTQVEISTRPHENGEYSEERHAEKRPIEECPVSRPFLGQTEAKRDSRVPRTDLRIAVPNRLESEVKRRDTAPQESEEEQHSNKAHAWVLVCVLTPVAKLQRIPIRVCDEVANTTIIIL